MNNEDRLYPTLPVSASEMDATVYRLKKIEEIQSTISTERDRRERTYKKLKRIVTAINYVENGTGVLGVVAGAIGIPAILGVISAPIGLALEGIAMGSVGFMVILKYTMKRLTAKMKKHEKNQAHRGH